MLSRLNTLVSILVGIFYASLGLKIIYLRFELTSRHYTTLSHLIFAKGFQRRRGRFLEFGFFLKSLGLLGLSNGAAS